MEVPFFEIIDNKKMRGVYCKICNKFQGEYRDFNDNDDLVETLTKAIEKKHAFNILKEHYNHVHKNNTKKPKLLTT